MTDAQADELLAAMKRAVDMLEHNPPPKAHDDPCWADAGCDMLCVENALHWEQVWKFKKLIRTIEGKRNIK